MQRLSGYFYVNSVVRVAIDKKLEVVSAKKAHSCLWFNDLKMWWILNYAQYHEYKPFMFKGRLL